MGGLPTGGSSRYARGARGRVTLQVIANELSVSTATVSLALRDSPVVAEGTKRSVQRLARELGYTVSRSASLKTPQSRIIAVAAGDLACPGNVQVVTAIEELARLSGKTILISPQPSDVDGHGAILTSLKEQQPDGLIVKIDDTIDLSEIAGFLSETTPTVLVGRTVDDVNFDYVGFDRHRAASLAAMHMHGLGHQRVALIVGGAPNRPSPVVDAYRRAFAMFGLMIDETMVHVGYNSRETGIRAIESLVSTVNPPTAAVCTEDLIALGAMSGLRRLGLEAGRNFSLMGCGNIPEASHAFPGLTTIGVRYDDIGRIAADLLFKRMDDPDGKREHIVLDPVLVVRGTTASPVAN